MVDLTICSVVVCPWALVHGKAILVEAFGYFSTEPLCSRGSSRHLDGLSFFVAIVPKILSISA